MDELDLLFDCRLVWPNGRLYMVRLLRLANGYYFSTGWPEFIRSNGIVHGDYLTFTLVDVGTFNVKRYDMGTHCPRRETSIVIVEDDDKEGSYSPDIDTSDDYEPSETESDSSNRDEYEDDTGALNVNGYPTFVISLTQKNINRTLEIPHGFCKCHIRMGPTLSPRIFVGRRGDMGGYIQPQRVEDMGEARVGSIQTRSQYDGRSAMPFQDC
ncbi:hypothetical protein SASPL_154162 [Salvia splendens]|uniref:TF-B3 domain-containing protein n=1 Tax=Salvia splendens TaxID=180675 RepID=A0A8X8VZV2_SALSN|nr:hypothetical protein SASPL_154162 [Salvia splendens]